LTAIDLLTDLAKHGVKLVAEGEQLSVNAPTGVLTAEHRALLAAHKAELLLLLRSRREEARVSARAIVPDPFTRHEPFPLTDIQQAYWIGRAPTMELGGVGCHAYREIESASIDVPRLAAAWNRVIERHDMLRAVFLDNGTQRILPHVDACTVPTLDLRDRSDADLPGELEAIRGEMSHRLFDPREWPLFDIRATLLPSGRTRIHIGLDLLIADAASMLLLFREWEQFYRDPELRLAPLDLSFRDYVLAEERRRTDDEYRAAEAYWFARLEDFPSAPKLPTIKAPSSIRQPRFHRRSSRLEAGQWSRLKRRAAEAGLTPSAAVCAAYADVLSLWSGSRRFALTLTLFNRTGSHPEMASIVGDFTSTILLEADTSALAFEMRAQRLQSRLADDLSHSAVSGVRVLRELNRVRRETDVTAIPVVFTSALGHRNVDPEKKSPLGWLGATEFAITQTPQVWIDHHVYEEEGALIFSWDSLDELFPPRMLDEMFDGYATFLRALAADETAWGQRRGALLPQSHRDRHNEANDTAGFVADELLHDAFVRQARLQPNARAVVASDRTLLYGELDVLTGRWAHELRSRGAAANALVAVVMEKGWRQVAAVLAILRAGAAYLPIDPALPQQRISDLLRDAEVSLALTQAEVAAGIEWPKDVEAINFDFVEPLAATGAIDATSSPDDLAYAIYTSGSTGMPKGVMVGHRAARNTIADVNERFAVGPDDRVLALSSLSFDLSVYDIFGTLAAGGTIIIPPPAAARDPHAWSQLIEDQRITIWNSVPALMEMLVESGAAASSLRSLRLIMLSGDWIPLTLPPRIRTLAPEASVVSLGGATEAAIWSILYPIDDINPDWSSVPYGRPMRNQRFDVLSEDFEECPDLVTGRLFIAGAGLAKGYWNDAAKTAAKFVIHPRSGEWLYDTGDLGRWMPDGNIEFLGREDLQVKIQGHRIELGEIDAALLSHSRVRSAVAHAIGEREKRKLVAYVVLNDDSAERLEFKLAHHGLRTFDDAESIELSRPAKTHPLHAARRTHRRFGDHAVSLEAFSELLSVLSERSIAGEALPKRLYPSAGDLYPVQIYIHVKPRRVDSVEGGAYYYDPAQHRLVMLAHDAVIERDAHAANNRTAFDESSFSIFLVAEMQAIAPLYGSSARDFALLESGYIGQLLMTAAAAAGLGLCPIGTMTFDALARSFRLGDSHALMHSFVVGPVAASGRREPLTITQELRAHLRARLPEAMVPTDIVILDELPLSTNGKIDRARLPLPRAARSIEVRAPLNETGLAISRIVCEVLGVDAGSNAIDADTNFFDAGANSLHIVQIHRRIGEELRATLSLVDLFRHPTIRFLAAHLGESEAPSSTVDDGRKRAEARRAARQRRET
jgi:epothilone synthetase B